MASLTSLSAIYLLSNLLLSPFFILKNDRPQVKVKQGILEGRMHHSVVDNSPYYSFLGIPYAKPPVGNLRFKAPEPADFWLGIRPATHVGSPCSQKEIFEFKMNEDSNENCLFLNVFTPKLRSKQRTKLPVMFFIHGGGLLVGSGSPKLYGPDFLLHQQIVLVTTNYRLGPLGFLSLQNSLVPGNNGLKDLVMALMWVQENIKQFGGDPTQITIFGQSGGGALAHMLTLSPLSKNLFNKAIFMSGTAYHEWTFQSQPRALAYELGKSVGYLGDSDEELLEVLRNASTGDLMLNSMNIYQNINPLETYYHIIPFAAVAEPESPEAFLTAPPRELVKSGKTADVPILLGTTSSEGLLAYLVRNTTRDNVELNTLVTKALELPITTQIPDEILQKVEKFYFPDGSYDIEGHIKLLSFVFFERGVAQTVKILRNDPQRNSPTFLYKFHHPSRLDLIKVLSNYYYHSKFQGVAHSGELGCLFHGQYTMLNYKDYSTMLTITKAWTDFAWVSDPWPEEPGKTLGFNFIEIDTDLRLEEGYLIEERKLWDSLEFIKNP